MQLNRRLSINLLLLPLRGRVSFQRPCGLAENANFRINQQIGSAKSVLRPPKLPDPKVCGKERDGRCADQLTPRKKQVVQLRSNSFVSKSQREDQQKTPKPIHPDPLQSDSWKCSSCSCFNTSKLHCDHCLQRRSDIWKCFGCGKLNQTTDNSCSSCNAAKDLGLYLISRGEELTENYKEWVCSNCKTTTPLRKSTCRGCGQVNCIVEKALNYKGNGNGLRMLLGKKED